MFLTVFPPVLVLLGGGTISSIESRLSINEDGEDQGNSSSGTYLSAKHPLPQRRSPDGREFRECDTEVVNINQCNGEQVSCGCKQHKHKTMVF